MTKMWKIDTSSVEMIRDKIWERIESYYDGETDVEFEINTSIDAFLEASFILVKTKDGGKMVAVDEDDDRFRRVR